MTESTQADKQRCTKWILKDENDQFNRNTTSCCLRFFTLHLCSWYYYYEIITHFNVTSDQRSNEVLLSWSSNAHKKIHYLLIVFSLLICLRVQTKFPFFFFIFFVCEHTQTQPKSYLSTWTKLVSVRLVSKVCVWAVCRLALAGTAAAMLIRRHTHKHT